MASKKKRISARTRRKARKDFPGLPSWVNNNPKLRRAITVAECAVIAALVNVILHWLKSLSP